MSEPAPFQFGWAWHPHHASDLPCESLTEPIEVRQQ